MLAQLTSMPPPSQQLIEFFLPALCVAVLYFIKLDLQSDPNSSLKSTVVPPSYPAANDTIIPLSFQDYVTAIQAKRVCVVPEGGPGYLVISGIDWTDWAVPFVFCNSYSCNYPGEDAAQYCTYKTLAVAPMNPSIAASAALEDENSAAQRVKRFKEYVEKRYPQLTNRSLRPFDYDFIQIFDSNEELQSYVTSDNYGQLVDGKYFPKVAIGVVFGDGEDGKSYDYTIRVNTTNYNSQEQAVSRAKNEADFSKYVFRAFPGTKYPWPISLVTFSTCVAIGY